MGGSRILGYGTPMCGLGDHRKATTKWYGWQSGCKITFANMGLKCYIWSWNFICISFIMQNNFKQICIMFKSLAWRRWMLKKIWFGMNNQTSNRLTTNLNGDSTKSLIAHC